MAYQPLQRPGNIAALLDTGISLYTTVIRHVILLSLIIAVIGVLPELLFPTQYTTETAQGTQIAVQQNDYGWVQSVVSVLVTIASIIFSAMLLVMVYEQSEQRPVSYQQALQKVAENWLSVLLTMMLYGAMVFFGLFLFIVPAIYAYVTFMFALFFVLLYNDGPFAALRNSFYLVQGNWWRSFGFILIVSMFILAIIIVLFSLFSVNLQPGDLSGRSLPPSFFILIAIAIALVTPLMTAMQVVLYRDLGLRKAKFELDS